MLNIPTDTWAAPAGLLERARRLAETAMDRASYCTPLWRNEVLPALQEAYARFLGERPSRVWLRADRGSAAPK
jgi:hypothetical protein